MRSRANRPTVRGDKLRALGAPKGLRTTGFRAALRELAEADDAEFTECFGNLSIVPASFLIKRRGPGEHWDDLHVYEISDGPVAANRISQYGWIADGSGPRVWLHIFDGFGRERIVDNDALEMASFLYRYQRKQTPDFLEITKGHAPEPPLGARTRKWKAAYDALLEMGVDFERT